MIYNYVAVGTLVLGIVLLVTAFILLRNANKVESKYRNEVECKLASKKDNKCLYWDDFNKKCRNGKSDGNNGCKANQPILPPILFFLAIIFLSISIWKFIEFSKNQSHN